jgi:prephenate dehydratase
MFWLDFEQPQNIKQLDEALTELSYFAKDIKIL